jgi:hypothetical protein
MVSDPRSQLQIGAKIDGLCLEVVRGEMASLFMDNLVREQLGPYGHRIFSQITFADPGRKFLDAMQSPEQPAADDVVVELSGTAKVECLKSKVGRVGAGARLNP